MSNVYVGADGCELLDEIDRLRAENQRLGYEIETLRLEREEPPSWEGLLLEYRHRQGLS